MKKMLKAATLILMLLCHWQGRDVELHEVKHTTRRHVAAVA